MPPQPSAIDGMYKDAQAIAVVLQGGAELSLQIVLGDNFRKVLLLAAASYFEHRVSTTVIEFVRERSSACDLIVNFVKNKAVARQYHTWFNWNDSNANHFFGLFGPDFRAEMISRVNASDNLRKGIESFLELGSERNKLMHQDFATFPLEKTLDEIYQLYVDALGFVEELPQILKECAK